jgi:hypothetical protein
MDMNTILFPSSYHSATVKKKEKRTVKKKEQNKKQHYKEYNIVVSEG